MIVYSSTIPTRLRLLVVTELFPRPGLPFLGSFVVAQLRELARHYDITVLSPYGVTLRWGQQPVQQHIDGLTVQYAPYTIGDLQVLHRAHLINFETYQQSIKLRIHKIVTQQAVKLHTDQSFSLVHGHEAYVGDEVGPIGKKLGIPSFFTLHGLYGYHRRYFGERVMHRVVDNLHHTDHLVAVSHRAAASYAPHGLPADQFTIIPNGVQVFGDSEKLRTKLGIPEDALVLSAIGFLADEKRVPSALQALEAVRQTGRDARLLIVGKGLEEYHIRQLVDTAHLDDVVTFVDPVAPEDMGSIYRSTDILLHPSISESFSMVCLEAMAMGVPVICTNAIGLVEYIDPVTDAVVVPADDTQAFITATVSLAADSLRQQQLSSAGQQRAQHMTWQLVADSLTQLYGSAL